MKQVNLQDVGLTDRYNRNRAQSNFKAIEDAFNSNAITVEEMYAELNGKLAAEANTRYGEDVNLQGQINALRDRLSTDEGSINDLQKRITSLEDQVKKLNEIIFGTRYINDTDEIPLDDSMTSGNDVEVNDTETVNDDEAEVRTPDHDVLADEVN